MSVLDLAARHRLSTMIEGYRASALVHVAAELGIATLLAERPRTAAELAQETRTNPRTLGQVLRALCGLGVLAEDDGALTLTPAGAFLDPRHPMSLHGQAVYFGGPSYLSYSGLVESLREGGIAFDHVFGMPYYSYLDREPAMAEHYHRMIALPAGAATVIGTLFDFTTARQIVDVGGGNGSLLAEILTLAPQARGVLLELPLTEPSALATLATAPGGDRCEFVAGDFREHVPAGGDVYVLSRVLANWADPMCERILGNCRDALRPGGRLLVFEMMMPDQVTEGMRVVDGDMNALAHLGGAVRTRAEFTALLGSAGLKLDRVQQLPNSQWTLLEASLA
ncbi:methyltransferase [Nocardia sp. NRRL S-836]|uniref:methyltransferase n=1 Tax=Nocardia sp. NRRL S-836 TaxID=1519492 RepID=UPI0006AFCBD6|nr:methyltransferase [Nocardia sp. NRRL S-836]KOV78042.1 hypothetical protein ADL03_41140 [Nocardia sp. NRRL S-836]